MRRSTPEVQYCYVCGTDSNKTRFYRNASRFNGLSSACAECAKLLNAKRKRKSTPAHREAARRYYQRNRVTILSRQRQRYHSDPEYRNYHRAKSREWYRLHGMSLSVFPATL